MRITSEICYTEFDIVLNDDYKNQIDIFIREKKLQFIENI